jgi:hypothetical protein
MWKTAFFFGMMISLGVKADTCNIQNIEGIVSLLKQSPQEKHYREATDRLLELRFEQETRRSRPEFSGGFNLDKDNSSNNEITAELLFNIDDYRNYGARKKVSLSDRGLKAFEFQKGHTERLNQVAVSLFKISQNQFFLEKVEGLINTILSSEAIYRSRPIRSREDEIILSSLGLLKNNLILKKARLQDYIFEDKLIVKNWDDINCVIDYKTFTSIINELDFQPKGSSDLLSMKELQLKAVVVQSSTELETRRYFSNLKIGPSISRDRSNDEDEYRLGIQLEFDFPSMNNSNFEFIQQTQNLANIDSKRAEKNAEFERSLFQERFKKYSESLADLPSIEKLEADIKKIKKSFDAGVISPLVYLDSYRSFIDFLEVSEDVRLNVLQSYLKLRGLYVENNSL